MYTRRLAPLALAAAVVLGATGCSMISPQATLIEYAPSDGINADVGVIELRNALIVADDEGTDGNFIAAVINTSDEAQTLRLEIITDQDTITGTIRVGAGDTLSLGTPDEEPLLLEGIDTIPGAMLEVGFSTADSEVVVTSVPVLDGGLAEYSDLVP